MNSLACVTIGVKDVWGHWAHVNWVQNPVNVLSWKDGLVKSIFGQIFNCNDEYLSIDIWGTVFETIAKFANLIYCRSWMWKKSLLWDTICGQR